MPITAELVNLTSTVTKPAATGDGALSRSQVTRGEAATGGVALIRRGE